MLFHEVYGTYFLVISAVLEKALNATLTAESLQQLVQEKAFAESILTIPAALQNGEWPLLDQTLHTPLHTPPSRPLTTLEKRWMKALLLDSRVKLFAPSIVGLENIEPLFTPDLFVYFDRYADGDPFEEPSYIDHFHTICKALKEKRKLSIDVAVCDTKIRTSLCSPYKLEYSSKDDKFRMLAKCGGRYCTINLGRIIRCELLDRDSSQINYAYKPKQKTLILELIDERNALERAMLHFSNLKKKTVRLDDKTYQISLQYEGEDETELLIRVLSFGPMLRVIAPESFLIQIKSRLQKQKGCAL